MGCVMNFEKLPELPPRRPAERRRMPAVGWWGVGLLLAAGLGAGWWWLRAGGGEVRGAAAAMSTELSAEEMAKRVEDLRAVTREHGAAGRWEQAEETISEAGELQQEINERFAGSPYASVPRRQEIEVELQTVRITPVLAEVARQDALAATHLRKRELYQAQRIIAAAWEQIEAAVADAPLARGLNEELRMRLNFLNRRHAELGWMQDLAHEALVPDAEVAGQARMETGPGWELYTRVLGAGAGSTREERAEFCRRLGWVLGMPVRPAVADAGAARGAFLVVVETGAAEN